MRLLSGYFIGMKGTSNDSSLRSKDKRLLCRSICVIIDIIYVTNIYNGPCLL